MEREQKMREKLRGFTEAGKGPESMILEVKIFLRCGWDGDAESRLVVFLAGSAAAPGAGPVTSASISTVSRVVPPSASVVAPRAAAMGTSTTAAPAPDKKKWNS